MESWEEKSLRHVAMVAKFLDDNKPKTLLKKWIRTVSNVIDFIPFHLICQILATLFQVLNPKGQDLSLQKGKENFYVVFTCSITWAGEIRKFHVAVGRDRSMVITLRWKRPVQLSSKNCKSREHVFYKKGIFKTLERTRCG